MTNKARSNEKSKKNMQGITPRTSLWECPHKRLLSLLPIIHLFPVPSSVKRRKTKQFNQTTYPVLRLAESANVTQLQNVFSTTRTTWTTNQDVNKEILETNFVTYDDTQLHTSWSPFDLLVWVLRNTEHTLWTYDHPFRIGIQNKLSYSDSWPQIFVTTMISHLRRMNAAKSNI